ncbi:ALK tyrosine kinase receptor-like [Cyprinus carpio]|nr:ALK tyrosine kinase receptor-like [Cyprinus carpio]
MTQSWQHQPEDRPNFSTILERIDYCLQDPDVVNVPLPVEYGPIPEEEERVPMRPEDPSAPSLLVTPQGTEDASSAAHSDQPKRDGEAVLMDSKLPPDPLSQPHPHHHHQPPVVTAPIPAAKPSSATPLTTQDGGHVNLGFMQAHPLEKESHNGKPTNLWNPTYGSWFLQQQQKRQQAQAQRQASSPRIPGEGQEQAGRTVTVAEALGLQQQHKQQQYQQQLQRQQQQGLCRPLLPPPAPTPLLLDSATLAPVPLYRLRRFPCGNIGYGYQEQGLPMEPMPGPQPPPPHPGQQRPISLARASGPEDSRPLLVTMGIVQDSRLPKMEGHNATVL